MAEKSEEMIANECGETEFQANEKLPYTASLFFFDGGEIQVDKRPC